MQVLIDADNVSTSRVDVVLAAVLELRPGAEVTASGSPAALEATTWPGTAVIVPAVGWQRADIVLARAYRPGPEPLVIVSGDGDFALLAARHSGPVLVVSAAASRRLHGHATVTDPAVSGPAVLRAWLAAV